MKVVATRTGFYEHRRYREGQEFELKREEDFSKHWMEVVGAGVSAPLSVAERASSESGEESKNSGRPSRWGKKAKDEE